MSGRGPAVVLNGNAKPNWSAGQGYGGPVPLAVADEAAFYRACRMRVEYLQRGECRPWMWRRLGTEFKKAKGNRRSYMAEWCEKVAREYQTPRPRAGLRLRLILS